MKLLTRTHITRQIHSDGKKRRSSSLCLLPPVICSVMRKKSMEDSKINNKVANRVLLAGAVIFIFAVVVPFITQQAGIQNLHMNSKYYIGFVIGAAIIADRLYIKLSKQ